VQKVAAAIVIMIENAYPIMDDVCESVRKHDTKKDSET
jgi:hypothetical protein